MTDSKNRTPVGWGAGHPIPHRPLSEPTVPVSAPIPDKKDAGKDDSKTTKPIRGWHNPALED